MSQTRHADWKVLERELARHSRLLIAFSGGCDSAFLLAAARRVLGRDAVLAVTAVSDSLASAERAHAERLASRLDAAHQFVETQEFSNPQYLSNPPNRCFFCKDELFARLAPIAQAHRMTLADGFNRSDRGDYRPGLQAAAAHAVAHPLDAAGLDKRAIRVLSRWLGLPTWNKPASPCLSSRIPYGTVVTPALLRQIEKAESLLQREGFAIVRVRHFGDLARIEVPLEKIPILKEDARWARICAALRGCGYSRIAIEERGFRSGRLNETLAIPV
jgi:uncharacterized protein